MQPLVINWPLSSITGYGIYGLQILFHYLRRGGKEFALTERFVQPIDLPPDMETRLRPLLERAAQSAFLLEKNPDERLGFNNHVLHGVGNPYATFRNQYRVRGRPNIGCAAIEEAICPPDWRRFLEIYDRFITISQWNTDYLTGLGLPAPVHLCHQGINTELFRPGPKTDLWPGRFVIFSGGKFEFRKGQDIVTVAFKRFRERHPDALLVTAWQHTISFDAAPFAEAGHCTTTPQLDASGTKLEVAAWLRSQGLPEGSFVDTGWQHNSKMPDIMRACDVAIFPNRCEGGTNLVAMETIACGVPVYVAANTGQKDLVTLVGCAALERQKPLPAVPDVLSVDGWGESDVDEIVAALEYVYDHPGAARERASACAERIKGWDWSAQNEKLLQFVYGAEWPKA